MTTNPNLQPSTANPINEAATISHVDPATLLVDRNVRHDAQLDREFLASVRDLGVLVPIVAVRTADGSLRVRYGHRRTLAAVEAGHPYVPVVVVADEGTDDTAEVERLVGQYAENEHRTALTTAERVDVFTQLSAFGVSAAQIAKRTKTRRGDVDAALSVAGSEVAQAVATRYDFLDLLQAAVVAEFDDDSEAVKALVKAARDGGFEHLAQRLRDRRAEAAEVSKVLEALHADGVQVIDQPSWKDPAKVLDALVDEVGGDLDAEGHGNCPGHAAYTGWQWAEDDDDGEFVAVYVCTDPTANGHRSRGERTPERHGLTDEQRAAASAERRQVVANNKAWKSAETVRREWLRGFLARKTAPKGVAVWAAQSLVRADSDIRKALERAHWDSAELFGAGSVAELTDATVSDGRAQMVALGLILAAYELGTGTHSWRNGGGATGRYLGFLAAHGYELSAVERLACGDEPPPASSDEGGEGRS